jgi:hypothetical protein
VPHSFSTNIGNGLGMDSISVIAKKGLYVPPTGIPLEKPSTLRLIGVRWSVLRVLSFTIIFNLRSCWLVPNLANTSRECCGNLEFVLAFSPWDLGCALFVVFRDCHGYS